MSRTILLGQLLIVDSMLEIMTKLKNPHSKLELVKSRSECLLGNQVEGVGVDRKRNRVAQVHVICPEIGHLRKQDMFDKRLREHDCSFDCTNNDNIHE